MGYKSPLTQQMIDAVTSTMAPYTEAAGSDPAFQEDLNAIVKMPLDNGVMIKIKRQVEPQARRRGQKK